MTGGCSGARPGPGPGGEGSRARAAAEGRRAGRLGRPISDLAHNLGEAERRAWRAGWRLGREEAQARRVEWEAGVLAYGRGAPRRAGAG